MYLWNKCKDKKYCGQDNDSTREECSTDVDIASQNEHNEHNDHQNNAGDVDQSSHELGVIECTNFDLPCLESENNPQHLEQAQVDEDQEVKVESRSTSIIAAPHLVLFTYIAGLKTRKKFNMRCNTPCLQ